jgi:hypothetical protein
VSSPVIAVQTANTADTGCTDYGCLNALLVELGSAELRAGDYEIAIIADGQSARCTIALPQPFRAGREPDEESQCAGELQVILTPAYRNGDVIGIESLVLSKPPREVSVTVRAGGAEVGHLTTAPQYTVTQPNGAACAPTCRTGGVKVDLARAAVPRGP